MEDIYRLLMRGVAAQGLPLRSDSADRCPPTLLIDPFLQLPTASSVRVIWCTEFVGTQHVVLYGTGASTFDIALLIDQSRDLLATVNRTSDVQVAFASTKKFTRLREDRHSRINSDTNYTEPTYRAIWRHEALIEGLTPGLRVSYRVFSVREDEQAVLSACFTLAPQPTPNTALKILLTSDHQLKPMVAANLQKVVETVGRVDAVFMAGDLVETPDRASEWFDDERGSAFFPCFQGRARMVLEKNGVATVYTGGEILQHAPIYPVMGNHDVMGCFSMKHDLITQFYNAYPRVIAEARSVAARATERLKDDDAVCKAWITNQSFNYDTFTEIFKLPTHESVTAPYYAVTFGNVRLVALHATRIWRSPKLEATPHGQYSKYREREANLHIPTEWDGGEFIFEPIAAGSPQYGWLVQELASPAFQAAKYKIVMLHHPLHSLGEGIVPAFTDPRQKIERDADGRIKAVRYEYPKHTDYLIRDIQPLLIAAGVDLVFFGHSHVWNRFVSPSGIHFLESSNVGNSYGAFQGQTQRPTIAVDYAEAYAACDDPYGLEPIVPSIAPLRDENDIPLPYLASNDITAFSILDTSIGTVSSYYFDTSVPNSPVVKFDEFMLKLT